MPVPTDGGTATVVVSGVNIDLVKPSVKATGVRGRRLGVQVGARVAKVRMHVRR